jgi:drug/metabolite transporter (DMT)-like permease
MFIGEMGCWLVIFASSVYRSFIYPRLSPNSSPLLAGGYNPVHPDDIGDEEDHTIDGPDASNHTPKHTDAEGRVYLSGRRILLLALPACCDIAGTTLMNVGLLFVAASIYQMTRGALVLFVGFFSVLFLRRKLFLYQWIALFVVVLGVALVGLAGALFAQDQGHDVSHDDTLAIVTRAVLEARELARTPEALKAIIGVLLIAAAQIFTASQFVSEEWILENYAMDPLEVVGWEGIFGFSVTVIASIILYLTIGRTEAGRYGYFDAKEGWRQVFSNKYIAMASILIMISIGFVILQDRSLCLMHIPKSKWLIFILPQGLQFLRPFSHPNRICHLPQYDRHLPDTLHLARIARSRLGNIQVAASPGLCASRLRNLLVQ